MTAAPLDENAIRDKLRAYICGELLRMPSYPLGDDEPLITGGIIDSFCVANLGVFIERELGVYIPDADLTVQNMDTVRSIGAQILRRAAPAAPGDPID